MFLLSLNNNYSDNNNNNNKIENNWKKNQERKYIFGEFSPSFQVLQLFMTKMENREKVRRK